MAWLEQAAQLTIVLGFLGTLFAFSVLRPLNESIKELRTAIDGLRDDFKRNNERLNRLEGAVAKLEQAVVTAHARIDKFLHEEATANERLGY